jgi:hypothetical protein
MMKVMRETFSKMLKEKTNLGRILMKKGVVETSSVLLNVSFIVKRERGNEGKSVFIPLLIELKSTTNLFVCLLSKNN